MSRFALADRRYAQLHGALLLDVPGGSSPLVATKCDGCARCNGWHGWYITEPGQTLAEVISFLKGDPDRGWTNFDPDEQVALMNAIADAEIEP